MNKQAALLLLQVAIVLAAAVVPAFAGVTTPEPASVLLVGAGIGALILLGRWKRSQK